MTVRFLISLLIALLCFTSSKADKVSLLPSPETSSVFMSSFATAALLYPLDLLRSLSMTSPGTPVPKLVGDFYKDFGAKGFVSQVCHRRGGGGGVEGGGGSSIPQLTQILYRASPPK